jgi:tRNA pseudouridine38-40 synthase
MAQRLKLTIAYDGSAFAGWQSQARGNTVQDQLEAAFRRIIGASVRVHGAGRTDAGVHALAQSAHVDVPDRRLSPSRWISALNALLPPTIRVSRCRFVAENFHARFSVKGKVYRYRIWTGPILPPLEVNRAWHIVKPLEFHLLRAAGTAFEDSHDFAAFAANRGKREPNTVRTIRSVRVSHKGACVTIEFDGDGFLYKMVRLMVGAMINVATGKLSLQEVWEQLHSKQVSGMRLVAPAQGLYLVKIWY